MKSGTVSSKTKQHETPALHCNLLVVLVVFTHTIEFYVLLFSLHIIAEALPSCGSLGFPLPHCAPCAGIGYRQSFCCL